MTQSHGMAKEGPLPRWPVSHTALGPACSQAPCRTLRFAAQAPSGRPHLEDVDVEVGVGQQRPGEQHAGQGGAGALEA